MEILKDYGIPVWVMEPQRGGYLATLAEEEAKLNAMRPNESMPAKHSHRGDHEQIRSEMDAG